MFNKLFGNNKASNSQNSNTSTSTSTSVSPEHSHLVDWGALNDSIKQRVSSNRLARQPVGHSLGESLRESVARNTVTNRLNNKLTQNAARVDNFIAFDAMVNPQNQPTAEAPVPLFEPSSYKHGVTETAEHSVLWVEPEGKDKMLIDTIRQIESKLRALRSGAFECIAPAERPRDWATKEALEKLCTKSLLRLAQDSNTPPGALRLLAHSEDLGVRRSVADNNNLPLDAMWFLAKDQNLDIRHIMAENHAVPIEILEALAEDENPHIAARAFRTINRLRGGALKLFPKSTVTAPKPVKKAVSR